MSHHFTRQSLQIPIPSFVLNNYAFAPRKSFGFSRKGEPHVQRPLIVSCRVHCVHRLSRGGRGRTSRARRNFRGGGGFTHNFQTMSDTANYTSTIASLPLPPSADAPPSNPLPIMPELSEPSTLSMTTRTQRTPPRHLATLIYHYFLL